MNAPARGVPEPAAAVDAKNPWLGLASFTEETRQYFFGRDAEVAELARRVQRKLLTVLFGQSGLGKTSILRAGLVPRLRGQGYCPVYVRIDYGRDSPEPAEQIKQAIRSNARLSGKWSRAGVEAPGESLWEYLHHRDDVLRDESGQTLTPLLIFDQFEEIFTLAQSDDSGRSRAARFVADLADLVENRPPKEFEARLEEDVSASERFDFARSDYRVLIALREDYLAPLEGLRPAIPSISQNRLRLAPMSGAQALAAVLQPGKGLVSQEVAEAIVRFVAGGAEVPNAVVEPSLLSLICRELNDARLAQGRAEISQDLLAGSHATILSNFYERSLADQSPAVRRIVEDELLTASGFRENVAEESLTRHFTAAGAAPGTLALLVNRRLLRIEERLDVRRVELTHDVLCGVVKASRDLRHEREARETTERLLAQQRERELAARRAAVRARQVAAACTVLAVVAAAAAIFAWFSGQRARRAEHEAQLTRALAEQARGHAEHLLGYLSDDFAEELESFGRLEVLAEFSQRQIDYFHGLPQALRGPESIRNGALALVHHSRAERTLGQIAVAGENAGEAVKLLEGLRASGDRSAATTIALALAYSAQGRVLESRLDPASLPTSEKGTSLLRPLIAGPAPSPAAGRAFVAIASRIGYEQTAQQHPEDAVRTEREVMKLATDLGARDLRDLDMGAYYAEGGAWLVTALGNLGRDEEMQRVSNDCLAVADQVLERHPGHRLALHAEQVLTGALSQAADDRLDPEAALRPGGSADRRVQVSLTLLKLDPHNTTTLNNLSVAEVSYASELWQAGRLQESMAHRLKEVEAARLAAGAGITFIARYSGAIVDTAIAQAELGDAKGAEARLAEGEALTASERRKEPTDPSFGVADVTYRIGTAYLAYERGDLAATRQAAQEAEDALRSVPLLGFLAQVRPQLTQAAEDLKARVAYMSGDFATAERLESSAARARKELGVTAPEERRRMAEIQTWLALMQARAGRARDAQQTIAPVVKFDRELAARDRSDRWVPQELAAALYVQALADRERRPQLLAEAAGLMNGLPPQMKPLRDVRIWRTWIAQAQQQG